MTVIKILEATLVAGNSAVTFTDSELPNSLIRVYSSNSDIIPESRTLIGNTLTVVYPIQTSNIGVAVEIVKQGIDIVDNLTSTDSDKVLSAKQGKVLNDDITTLSSSLDDLSNTVDNLDIPDNITDLADVSVTSIQDGQVLAWDDTAQKFVNVNQSGGASDVIYSTTPVKIGKWIDNRDVYRVVFDLGSDVSILNTSFTNTSIDTSSMDVLVDVKAIYSTGVTVYNVMGNINNDILRLQADRNDNPISCRYIIVVYVEKVVE